MAGMMPVGAAAAETAGGPAVKTTYRQYLDQLRRDRENEIVLATRRVAEVKAVWVAIVRDDAFAARSEDGDPALMNRRRDAAILRVYDFNSDGILAPEEKERYRADMALAFRYAGKSRKPAERKRVDEAKKQDVRPEAAASVNPLQVEKNSEIESRGDGAQIIRPRSAGGGTVADVSQPESGVAADTGELTEAEEITVMDPVLLRLPEGVEARKFNSVVVRRNGQEIRRKYDIELAYDEWRETHTISCIVPGAAWDDPGNRIAVVRRSGLRSKPLLEFDSGGTGTIYEYSETPHQERITRRAGGMENSYDDAARRIVSGTRTVTVRNKNNNAVIEQVAYDIASGIKLSGERNTYDLKGRLIRTDYADGSSELTAYRKNLVASRTDRNGSVRSYEYDRDGRLIAETFDGIVNRYRLDAAGRVTGVTVVGRNGGTIDREIRQYDAAGRPTAATDAVDAGRHLGGPGWPGNPADGTAVFRNPIDWGNRTGYGEGSRESRIGDDRDRLLPSTLAVNRTAPGEYDVSDTTVRTVVDLNADGTDDAGDLVTETRTRYENYRGVPCRVVARTRLQNGESAPLESRIESVDGNESWYIDRRGGVTHHKRERAGEGRWRELNVLPDGTATVRTFCNGRLLAEEQWRNNGNPGIRADYEYDEFNRMIRQTESLTGRVLNTVDLAYDRNDQLISRSENDRKTLYRYDAMGRLQECVLPDGRVETMVYDRCGKLESRQKSGVLSRYEYNDRGEPASLTLLADGEKPVVFRFLYDSRQHLAGIERPDGSRIGLAFDAAGFPLRRTLARKVDGEAVAVFTEYDAAGRLTGIRGSGQASAVRIAYDLLDRPVTVADSAGTRKFTYVEEDGVLTVTETVPWAEGWVLGREYDVSGRLRKLILPMADKAARTIDFDYDGAGNPAMVSDGSFFWRCSYGPAGRRPETITWSNGAGVVPLTVRYRYDGNRLSGISGRTPAGTQEIALRRDADGRVIERVLPDGVRFGYDYDRFGRMLSAAAEGGEKNRGGGKFEYTYDGFGRRIARAVESADGRKEEATPVNVRGRYLAVGDLPLEYDADGNLVRGFHRYRGEYDSENRLIRLASPDIRLEFSYDYRGRCWSRRRYAPDRAGVWTLRGETRFLYDGDRLLAEYRMADGIPVLEQSYVWAPPSSPDLLRMVPLWNAQGAEYRFYFADDTGSVLFLLDETGTVNAAYDYAPDGSVINARGRDALRNPWRQSAIGYTDSETGLVLTPGGLWYSPELGELLSGGDTPEPGFSR